MKKKRVLVIGDIMLDHYINVSPNKVSSESPILVFDYQNDYYSLGGSSNVCKYLSGFKMEVDLFGVIGTDYYSKKVLELLKTSKIKTQYVFQKEDFPTIVKNRFNSPDFKQVMRVDIEKKIDIDNYVLGKLKEINNNYDLIIISDYRKGVITKQSFDYIVSYAKKNNIKVICDPKDNQVNYHDLFILKPNKKEMENLIGDIEEKNIIDFKKKNKIDNIVLTLGNMGMKLFDINNNVFDFPAYQSDVFDVTGAGDCVLSYLAYGILNDLDLNTTCKYSNYAASLKVRRFGTAMVNEYEVLSNFNNKVVNRKNLKDFCNYLCVNNKIVFTNGCFDIIHSGHIHLLKKAKELGDVLILGLNTDASIKRLKGNSRPIFEEKERVEVLNSIKYIDYIVLFNEDTPINIIEDIKPNILVKGADYKNKEIVGKEFVEKNGGKVVLIDLIEGKSTTNIINKIEGKNI